jgi:histidinol phosphatase-like PHP family hydrolase
MWIDLHVHSSERSECGQASEEEQIRAAIAAGLDALVFTDHQCHVPAGRLAALNKRYAPFKIFGGIEVTADGEDFLVLGLHDPDLEKGHWRYPDLHAFVRARGGFLALAHPFRYHAKIAVAIEKFVPDAVELYSVNTPAEAGERIRALAARLGIPVLSNSDAHSTRALGLYGNILEGSPADEAELIAMLKAGRIAPV